MVTLNMYLLTLSVDSGTASFPTIIKVGSRASELAMIQTRTIIAELQKLYPSITFEVVTMKTIGDLVLDRPLQNIGQTNLFTKELETALAAKQVDFIVHSLKDLPTTLPQGMALSVIYKRDNPTDALVVSTRHRGRSIADLPPGSVIGTSSVRRIAQLRRAYPSLVFKTVRGNLNTRLSKLDESGEYDGLVLATAGLVRMGWRDRIAQELDQAVCMYAVGQGALAVEARSDDDRTNGLLLPLNDMATLVCCVAERSLLRTLEGGCSVPVAVQSSAGEGKLCLHGAVFSLDGSQTIQDAVTANLPDVMEMEKCRALGEKVGVELAQLLLSRGAGPILQEAKKQTEHATITSAHAQK